MTASNRETGSAMAAMVFVSIVIAGMVLAMVTLSSAAKGETASRSDRTSSLYVAEAGIAFALTEIRAGGTGALGDSMSPIPFGPGALYVSAVDNGDRTHTVKSTGIVRGVRRTLQADVQEIQGVFHHAMFAGNSSKDPNYVLKLAGSGLTADEVKGDIFSAGGIEVAGDAKVTGKLRAGGKILGATGHEGVSQPSPDIAAMNYASTADVDVAAEFAAHHGLMANANGGDALEVPHSLLSHIFRMNPTDRLIESANTVKDDYFLEDPGHAPSSSRSLDPAWASEVSLGDDGTPDGVTRLVFYIDGNLWIHNRNAMSFAFSAPRGENVLVTFVVQGNIYISDNIILRDKDKDAVALIAIKDPQLPDSGNIIFGDATFGTLELMEAYMFAENDFKDTNLPATGSEVVTVKGLMSAGNQIAIDREVGGKRTKLVLEHDDRLTRGLIDLPGIPAPPNQSYRMPFTTVSLVEVGSQ